MVGRRPLLLTGVLLVGAVVVDLLLGAEPFPGYAATIGLVGCIAIILVSKWLGKAFIQRPEDHYPEDIPQDRVEDLRGE